MRANEFLTEWYIGNIQIGEYLIIIDDHLIDRMNRPGRLSVTEQEVYNTIMKLPKAKAKFKELGAGQQFWLHDNTNDVSVGFRIKEHDHKTFIAKNVWAGRNDTVIYPTFEVK